MIYEERRGLASRIWRASDAARQSEALVPLATDICRVSEGPGAFEVRILTAAGCEASASRERRDGNPFLPYDERLFVAQLSDTHVCLLNKFPVIPGHALVVTRSFEPQTSALSPHDYVAAVTCLMAFDGLVFYNAGEVAGASEPHKHLQVVPLPLVSDALDAPITSWFEQIDLPFRHRRVDLASETWRSEESAKAIVSAHVERMLTAFDLLLPSGETKPYNLLLTRRWLMLVPRVAEKYKGISINGLGFAGAFLARDEQELAVLRSQGPMAALCHVAG